MGAKEILWGILWFLCLVFIAWPVGMLFSWAYVICLPFGVCLDICKDFCELLLKIVKFPEWTAQKMVKGEGC